MSFLFYQPKNSSVERFATVTYKELSFTSKHDASIPPARVVYFEVVSSARSSTSQRQHTLLLLTAAGNNSLVSL